MMAKNNMRDGGPAFPTEVGTAHADPDGATWHQIGCSTAQFHGMTLADWFAGQALAGMLAAESGESYFAKPQNAVAEAYKYADAMLAEKANREAKRSSGSEADRG